MRGAFDKEEILNLSTMEGISNPDSFIYLSPCWLNC